MSKVDIDRVRAGYKYFWDLKPSRFDAAQKVFLTKFLEMIKPIIDKYSDGEATPEDAEEIFNEDHSD